MQMDDGWMDDELRACVICSVNDNESNLSKTGQKGLHWRMFVKRSVTILWGKIVTPLVRVYMQKRLLNPTNL